MDVLRKMADAGGLPRVVLVHLSDGQQADKFFEARWPGVAAISDPDKYLYKAFGLKRGTLGQFIGLGAIWAGIRDLFKGYGMGKPQGDSLMMSGRFLISGERIIWKDVHKHAGAGTEYAELLRAYEALAIA